MNRKSLREKKNFKIKEENNLNEEKILPKSITLQEDSDDEEEKNEKNSNSSSSKTEESRENDDAESDNDSIDEERISLQQIEKIVQKARNKKGKIGGKSLLQRKTIRVDNGLITYDAEKGKILQTFSASPEELNEFLIHCQMRKISLEDFSSSIVNNSNSISFDPNEWMKSNQIKQRVLNVEDLSIICSKSKKKSEKNSKKTNNNNNNLSENDIEKEIEKKINEEKNEEDIGKKEKEKKLSPILLNNKELYDNYLKLKSIISCEELSIEQKLWINNLIQEISNIDIDTINVEKNEEGKDNKLEVVFDLDNTCIFSFLSHSDILLVQSKKNIFPKKEVKMISFFFNNKVLYAVLIIRKGLKEFINYVKPLCNFHISTLGAENYGNEIKDILSEYSGVEFIRYKGRLYFNEYSKNISDLYISREKTVIFDDNIKVWQNQTRDIENVINTKFFYDEECASLNAVDDNNKSDTIFYEIDLFLKSYRCLFYCKIKENKNKNTDWKVQQLAESSSIPFYQFKSCQDYNYNKCFTAEYLNSTKFQFIYMKNVIKVIYYLKFIYDIDIPLAIKLIRISTLNNMKFDLKYLSYDQKCVLTDLVKVCGGIVYEKDYRLDDEKVYLVASKRIYEYKKDDITKDLLLNPFYILINERFILDTYYFMTNIKDNINDPEYSFDEN